MSHRDVCEGNQSSEHFTPSSSVGNVVTASKALRDLYERYGSREAAEEAIDELTAYPRILENWATKMIRLEPGHAGDSPFAFDELPGRMREPGKRILAIAFILSSETFGKDVA